MDEDRFASEVWHLGTLGFELTTSTPGPPVAEVYFSAPLTNEPAELVAGRRHIPGAELLEVREFAGSDWLESYRRGVKPFVLGRHWIVDPREPRPESEAAPTHRRLLRIPARTAFGTGSHASTRLIVELLEALDLSGRRVLDLGTGTGILAMMAVASGAECVLAMDLDPTAIFMARANARLNGLLPRLVAGQLAGLRIESARDRFDLGLANLLPGELRPELRHLLRCLRPAADLLISGLLVGQEDEWINDLAALDLQCLGRRAASGWVALHLKVGCS